MIPETPSHILEDSKKEALNISYEGFEPEKYDSDYITERFTKFLEMCPYDSMFTCKIKQEKNHFIVEVNIKHSGGQYTALGTEKTLREAVESTVSSLSQQLDYWHETRFQTEKDVKPWLNVLFVDDDPISIKILEACFRQQGCRTRTAKDGQEALSEMKKRNYDLVVLDWNMAELSGKETVYAIDRELSQRRQNSDEELKKIPVLTYSVYDKSQIDFPKTEYLMQLGHLPKMASYRVLREMTKSLLYQLQGGLSA